MAGGVKVTFQTPGKFIVVGEHFVVHGVPAIAAPVTGVGTRVTVNAAPHDEIHVPVTGDAAAVAMEVFAAALQQETKLGTRVSVTVESSIPVGFGLGSSAAYSVGLAGALAKYAGHTIPIDTLRGRAHELETIIHGKPSGIDDTVISHRRPLLFIDGESRPVTLGDAFHFVLGSCDYPGATKDAVAAVNAQARAQPEQFQRIITAAKRVTDQAVAALASGDPVALGREMDTAHSLLSSVLVSTPELDSLVRAARDAGAFGAKLTGGGYGGFMVALTTQDGSSRVADALERAGAKYVLHTTVSATTKLEQ